ncbi:hypothetical protein NMY22_g1177 [Coprinellus aureogranulatus]|nr:hypothetical protein NMY22_g1177 [Coprinellus aureogranulatus]
MPWGISKARRSPTRSSSTAPRREALKRPSTSNDAGAFTGQYPPQKRNKILTPIALMAHQVFARGSPSPPPYSTLTTALGGSASAGPATGTFRIVSSVADSQHDGDDDIGDTDEEALGQMPSSPTRLPQRETASGPRPLMRRSTDESLIDGIEGGQLSVTDEQLEEQSQSGFLPHIGILTNLLHAMLDTDNISEHSDYSGHFANASPFIPKCYATPEIRTPVVVRGDALSSPYRSGFTFFNGAPVGGPFTPYASSNAFMFTRELMSPYVYTRANIFKFVPNVSAQKSPFMVLLHLLYCSTGAEGISIEDFGRIFAQCSLCDRYLYVDHQEMHMCSESKGLTNLRRFNTDGSGGNLTPEAVRAWLVDHYGSLSKRDLDVLFAFCSACHHVLVSKYGVDHPDRCPGRHVIRRNI